MIAMDPRPDARPDWDDLTVAEAIEELRAGEQSPYFDDFEADPVVLADCPNCGEIPVPAEGYCNWGCGYDFTAYAAQCLPPSDNLYDLRAA